MKTLLIIIILLSIPYMLFAINVIHKILIIKSISYRWLVNSILFPYHYLVAYKAFSRMTLSELNDTLLYVYSSDRWMNDYWFWIKIQKLLLKHIDNYK